MRKLVWALSGALLLSSLSTAQEWWQAKPYTEWSEKDVERMLDNSPWAKTHKIVILNPTTPANVSHGEAATHDIGRGDLEREKQNFFHLRFLTAKPVRMAFVRNVQLNQKDEASKLRFDRFIAQSDPEFIILTMSLSAIPEGASSLSGYMTTLINMRTTDLTSNTSLATDSGKRVFLTRYEPPGEDGLGAKYYFPRKLPDGSLLVTSDDKELRLETFISLKQYSQNRGHAADMEANRWQEEVKTDRIWMKFDVADMFFEGRLEI